SQRTAASSAGVTQAALSRALAEDSDPSADLVYRVANAHELSLEWLFREVGPMVRSGDEVSWRAEIRDATLREVADLVEARRKGGAVGARASEVQRAGTRVEQIRNQLGDVGASAAKPPKPQPRRRAAGGSQGQG